MSESRFATEREVFTPSQLTRSVRDLLEDTFPLIWLAGEISNFSKPASGHLYFTLKDAGAQVRCAMFKPKSTWLKFRPGDGMHVMARARVSLYEARGEFQLIVEHLEEAGEGALQREFERLKAKLAAEGLFESARKRALPRWPRRIGVITSPSGAAVRDVLSVLARRFPLAAVDILPVPVQGKEAPAAIVAALQMASMWARHDVILLTRGGGSLEDLWSFNDEAVARAIVASSIPVVSAIGHEIDFTIADFVADLRAPTPSAAAELLVLDIREIERDLTQRRERLRQLAQRALERAQQRVDQAYARLNALRPQARLLFGRERLANLDARLRAHQSVRLERANQRLQAVRARLLQRHPRKSLLEARQRLQRDTQDLRRSATYGLERRARHLGELARTLNTVSPLATLGRGYSILFDADGRVLRSAAQAHAGDTVQARLVDGTLRLRVEPSPGA